jgi:hypothetical protein
MLPKPHTLQGCRNENLPGKPKAYFFTEKSSLNNQSCIRGSWWYGISVFLAVWAAGPVMKKKIWADNEQLFFQVFRCKKNVKFLL